MEITCRKWSGYKDSLSSHHYRSLLSILNISLNTTQQLWTKVYSWEVWLTCVTPDSLNSSRPQREHVLPVRSRVAFLVVGALCHWIPRCQTFSIRPSLWIALALPMETQPWRCNHRHLDTPTICRWETSVTLHNWLMFHESCYPEIFSINGVLSYSPPTVPNLAHGIYHFQTLEPKSGHPSSSIFPSESSPSVSSLHGMLHSSPRTATFT